MFDADRRMRGIMGLTVAGTAVAFTLLSVLTGGFVVVPLLGPVDIAVGLAVPLGLCFGVPAAVGIGAGVLLTATLESALSWWTVLDAVAYGGVGVLAFRLPGTLPGLASEHAPGVRSVGQWLELLAVTVISATVGASALAWGAVVGWATPFHASALAEWLVLFCSTLVVGPPILLAYSAFEGPLTTVQNRRVLTTRSGAFWGGVVAPLLWFLFGTASSVLVGSRVLETTVGALALSVIVATYLPRRGDRSDDQQSQRLTPTDA